VVREGLVVIDRLSVPGHVVDFGLRANGGEIVAIAGQVGSGTSEVLRALAGLAPDARGHVSIAGRAMRLSAPQRSIRAGAVFASNDRKSEGLFLHQSVARNLLATRLKTVSRGGVLSRSVSAALAQRLAGLIGFDLKRLGAAAETLSGGNQQKVFLGRCLEKEDVLLLLFDEPTRGVDVGGRADIHNLVRHAASMGLRHLRIHRTRRDRGPCRHGGHHVRRPDHTDRPARGHDGCRYPRRDDPRLDKQGSRVSGVDSTTDGSAVSRVAGRMAQLNPAAIAVYAFVALLAALIIFGAFITPGFLSISNFSAILTSAAFVGIIAVGSTLIMLSGSLFSISPRHDDRHYSDPVHVPAALRRGRGDPGHVVPGHRDLRDPGRAGRV
jgi:ABC-type branched-subunit amino acid transport system ATPase component